MRREARERAVQFLFQADLNPPEDLELALNHFWEAQRQNQVSERKSRKQASGADVKEAAPNTDESALRFFAEKLIRGVLEQRPELDALLQHYALNWDLKRMAVVDRNILRLALFEMLHRKDIPPVVSINEAVDIAKRFSTEDSGRFVNGILDRIKAEKLTPARSSSDE